jgi:hypothetical protein
MKTSRARKITLLAGALSAEQRNYEKLGEYAERAARLADFALAEYLKRFDQSKGAA